MTKGAKVKLSKADVDDKAVLKTAATTTTGQSTERVDGKLIHPLAARFPPMPAEALDALVADIKENGLIDPIVLYEGKILDGVNRGKACLIAGIPLTYVKWDELVVAKDGKTTPTQYVWSKNLARRSLTASQRAVIALNLVDEFAGDAVARKAHKGSAKSEVAKLPLRSDTGKSRDKAARLAGVSPRYIQDAMTLKKKDRDDLLGEVWLGNLTLKEALQKSARGDADQRSIKEPSSGDALSEMIYLTAEAENNLRRENKTKIAGKLTKISEELQVMLGQATDSKCRLEDGLAYPVNVYEYPRVGGITANPEFKKKLLCNYSVGVGLSCGHQCAYCSTPSTLIRAHKGFSALKIRAAVRGSAIVDPDSVKRIQNDIPKGLTKDDTIQLSTVDDAWSPESRKYKLGRAVMEVLLKETPAQIRVLTKSAEVAKDFDLFAKYGKRVIVGLSTGIPANRADVAKAVEPNASTTRKRLDALKQAHGMGLRTFGMLCPCLPHVADTPAALEGMFTDVLDCGVEAIWLEPVNARGRAFMYTESALRGAGLKAEADAIRNVRDEIKWSAYTRTLIETAIDVAKRKKVLNMLHILLYPSGLTPEDLNSLKTQPKGIIWLEKEDGAKGAKAGSAES